MNTVVSRAGASLNILGAFRALLGPKVVPQPPAEARSERRMRLKQQRNANRALVTGVVRDTMLRAGVLGSQYKFKSLAIDPECKTFLVLIDLSSDAALADDGMLLHWERWIQHAAQSSHGLEARSVYWRRELAPASESSRLKAPRFRLRGDGDGLSPTNFGEI